MTTDTSVPDGVAPAPRRTFLRGETARVLLAPCSAAPTGLVARVKELDGPGAWPVPLGADGWAEWDTTGFRAGDYLLEVRSGDAVLTSTALHLRPTERPEMWFGNFFGAAAAVGLQPLPGPAGAGVQCGLRLQAPQCHPPGTGVAGTPLRYGRGALCELLPPRSARLYEISYQPSGGKI